MKIHIIQTLENNEQMCRGLLYKILDKVHEPDESTTTTTT